MSELRLNSLSVNVTNTLGRMLMAGLLQLLTIAAIARMCGPEGNGVYNVALLLPTTLAALLNLGISPANVYYLGNGSISISSAWRTTLRLWLVIVSVGFFLGCLSILFFADIWFPGVHSLFLWLALLGFPALLLLNLLCSIFQGMQQFRAFNVIMLAQPLLALLAISVLVLLGIRDVGWFLFVFLLSIFATLAIACNMLRAWLPDSTHIAEKCSARKILTYGYKAHLSNMLTLLNYKADMLLVNLYLGPIASGTYIIAVQLSERVWILSQSVSTVILPRLSELSSDELEKHQLTPLVSRWVLWITLLFAIVLAAIAYPLIFFLFGAEYVAAALPLWLLMPGIVLMAPARVLANDIASRGRPEINAYSSGIALIVNVFGNVLLIPGHGLGGAAVATSAAYISIFLICLFMHRHFTGVSVWENLIPCRQDFKAIKRHLGALF